MQRKPPARTDVEEAEIQQGEKKGIAKDERLKKAMRQHPQRDTPRVDSPEGEPPTPQKPA